MSTHERYLRDIAGALGPDWPVETITRWQDGTRAVLRRADGATLQLSVHPEHWTRIDGPHRLIVRVGWPENDPNQRYAPYGEDYTITVAARRGAAVAATEITRRLLPGYLHAYAQEVERKARHRETIGQLLATARMLAEILGYEPPQRSPADARAGDLWDEQAWQGQISLWKDHIELSVSGPESTTLHLRGIPGRDMARVVRGLVQAEIGVNRKDG